MPATRSVLLRHDLPDGTSHYDWLIEPADAGESGGFNDRSLIAFRIARPPDQSPGPFRAVRLPDHRRLYLDFEGELSGGRGVVRRIAAYQCLAMIHEDGALRLRLASDAGTIALSGARTPASRSDGELEDWVFEGRIEEREAPSAEP